MSRHSKLRRRTFVKGLGAAIGLPLLEAMLSANGFAAGSAGAPKRMAFVFVPNGVIVPEWEPKGEGKSWQLSPTLEPLAKVKDKVAFLVEGKQAGIFEARNIPADQMDPLLGIGCPNIVYPYLRGNIADIITRAGFPPVHLAEINFEVFYQQRRQALAEAAAAAPADSAAH